MKRIALFVLLPALALAVPDPEGLGTWIVPRVAFDCRLFEVLPGKAATVPDGFVPAGRAVKWKRGTIPAGMLRSFFDGSFEAMEGVSLAWSGALEASRFSPARVSVPLHPSAASARKLDLSVSASHSDVANAAWFDVGFAFRDAGASDEPPAAVPEETADSGLVPGDSGFGIVLRGSSGPVDPDVLLAIGNWRLAGFERVPVRPVGLDELRPRYAALAALAVQGADRLAEALCRDFEDPAGHGAALAWIAEAANALGSSDPHPPADAPFLSDRDYVEALVAVGLAAFCESDWRDEVSFEAILGLHWTRSPRSLRAHALARYAGQGNPAPGPRTLPAWRVGRPNRFEGDSPEARRAALELARSLVVRSVFGERDIPSAAVVFGLFPEAGPRLAAIDRGDSLPRVAASPVPAIAERAPLVGRAIRRAEEAAEADAAGYPPVRHPPPGEVEGLFLLAAPDRDPPVFVAGEPIHFDVALSNAGPFVVSVEESTDWHEFRVDGLEPLEWRRPSPFPRGSELSRHFWWELFPGAAGQPDRIDLADWISNAVPRRVSATLRRNLDLAGTRWAETEVEFEIAPATDADSFQDGERAFAAKRHALAEGLAFGARVDFPVRVVLDDPATPPAAARVGWSSHSPSADGLVPDAEPGPDGVARLRGVSFDGFDPFSSVARFARFRASARNAWARDFAVCLVAPTGGVWRVAATNALPWPAACEVAPGDDVVLRAIRRPVPTVRSEFEVPRGGLPAGGVGFDAEKGAFLPPLGDGETADFVVEAGSTVASPNQPGYSWFSVRPAGPLCAVQLARDRRDELRTPREAPADGWSHDPEKPLRFLSRGRGLFRPYNPFARFFRDYEWASGDESGEPLCGSVVLFRSRPRAAPDGEILFRYGAIVPPAALASSFETRYEVRFGSFPGFRSLEYVPRRCDASPVPDAPAPPAAPTGSGALLAAVAADGETAVFLGAGADGAFAPPTFPETVRFDPGAAASTPLARVRTLVVPDFVGNVPARAFEGLPALRCAVLPGWLRFVGARAFAGCPALEAAVFDDAPRSPLPVDVFDGAAPGFAVFLGSRFHPRRVPGDAAEIPRADGAPPLPATVVAAGDFGFCRWSFPGGVARYLGPRAEGGRLWRVREGAGAEVLHRAALAAPDPAELGGERVLSPAELRRLDATPPFLWERPAPGQASLAGFHSLEFRDGPLDDPLEIPAALPDGTPVVAIEPGAFSPFEPGEGRAGGPGGFAGRDAAWWASNAVELVVPEGVRVIGARAFAGFAPLRSVRLPSTLEEIGPEAFADCIALRRIELPPSVREIPAGAFKGCRRLEAAALGAPGVRIGPLAFAACPSLVAVSTRGRPASVDPWAFRDSPSARIVSHAEGAEKKPHAESAENAEFDSHAETAETKPHAESAEFAE